LFKFPKHLRTRQTSSRFPNALKPMAPKRIRAVTHNKVVKAKICLQAKCARSLGHHINTKNKPKIQFPTRVTPNEKNHPMLETNYVGL